MSPKCEKDNVTAFDFGQIWATARLPLFHKQTAAVSCNVQMQQKALHPAIPVDLMQSRQNSVRVHPFSSMSRSPGSRMCWCQTAGDEKIENYKLQSKTRNQMRIQWQFLWWECFLHLNIYSLRTVGSDKEKILKWFLVYDLRILKVEATWKSHWLNISHIRK